MSPKLLELLERARHIKMTPEMEQAQRESWVRALRDPCDSELTAEDLAKRHEAAKQIEPQYRWKGEGPPPASWYVGNTKVYRSYEDYCDD